MRCEPSKRWDARSNQRVACGSQACGTAVTANRNKLNAVVRQFDLGIDARKALSNNQVIEIINWRIREHDTVEQRVARGEGVERAKAIPRSQNRMKEIREVLSALDEQLAPGMQNQVGMGPITMGIILAASWHSGRVRAESAFEALTGVSPLEASSGNTKRYRLNRGGDRQLNMTLDIIFKT